MSLVFSYRASSTSALAADVFVYMMFPDCHVNSSVVHRDIVFCPSTQRWSLCWLDHSIKALCAYCVLVVVMLFLAGRSPGEHRAPTSSTRPTTPVRTVEMPSSPPRPSNMAVRPSSSPRPLQAVMVLLLLQVGSQHRRDPAGADRDFESWRLYRWKKRLKALFSYGEFNKSEARSLLPF